MTLKRVLLSVLFVTLATLSTAIAQNTPSRIEAAFQMFWTANSPEAAAQAVPDIEKSGVTFEEAVARLEGGRPYSAQQTGIVRLVNKPRDGVQHYDCVNVPENHDP